MIKNISLLITVVTLTFFNVCAAELIFGHDIPRTAADVNGNPVFTESVLETWFPVQRDLARRVRAGTLSVQEANARLQDEWNKSLEAAIKDELFYREAIREFEGLLSDIISQATNNARRGNSPASPTSIEREIRDEFNKSIARDTARMEEQMLRASGGAQALHQSLAARGISYETWRERLRRKAFTSFYFSRRALLRLGQPGPGRIQAYYQNNPEEFRRPDMIHFRHIFFSFATRGKEKAYEDAATVWENLADVPEGTLAARFAELARANSDDPLSRARGGEELWDGDVEGKETRYWLSDTAKAAKEDKPLTLSPLLDSDYGYHITMLIGTRQGDMIPFREAYRAIEARLASLAEANEMDRLYQSLQRQVVIRVFIERFPELYRIER